jgi:hypothetical protein
MKVEKPFSGGFFESRFVIFALAFIFASCPTTYSIFSNFVVAEKDLLELQYPNQLGPYGITYVNNQENTSKQGFLYNTEASSGGGHPQFNQDISGKYSNPKHGISSFDIPQGWFGSESMNGNSGIILTMHPGTSEEFFSIIDSPENKETVPIMSLVVQDKSELRDRQTSSGSSSSSLSTNCTELNPNSTATIDGDPFNVSTMKCSTTDSNPIPGIDFGNTEITKAYKHETPKTIYVLQLILSTEYSPNKTVDDLDITKFTPIVDSAAKTLKIIK